MERIEAVSGETRWKTDPFRTLFPADPAFDQRIQAARNLIDTPLDGTVKLTDVAITMDEQILALVERSGRVAAFDPATGKLMWKGATLVQQVHDADVGSGVLVVGGQASQLAGGPENLIVAIDARTGETLHRLNQLDGRVRWVRVAGGRFPAEAAKAVMVAGLDVGVTCYDLERGKTNWTIPGNQAFESRDAWIYGDRLFLLDDSRQLWLASISTGKLVDKPLETFEHLVGSGSVQGLAMGPSFSQAAFSTDRGVCLFDDTGRLIGIDSLEGGEADEGGLLPPVAAQDCFVAVETTPAEGPGTRNLYNIHTLDTKSAKLKVTRQLSLELPPRRIALLDGRIVITAGTNTIVYSAPEADR
jgi:outer membrane protein assembly factor BamB